eukprot:gene4803-5266_t
MASLGDEHTEIVVTIAASTVVSNESPLGHLTLYRQSDTVYLVEYKDYQQIVRVDIDSVHVDVKRQVVNLQEPGPESDLGEEDIDVSYFIPDRQHLQIFHNSLRECQETCNYTLEMLSRLRTVYNAALSQVAQAKEVEACSEFLEELRDKSKNDFINYCREKKKAAKGRKTTRKGVHNRGKDRDEEDSVRDLEEGTTKAIRCFYCAETNEDEEYILHPYVPRGHMNERLYLCRACVENWKLYRDVAIEEGSLVLPGEVNEEICALCSNTPDTLILCSHCSRSYCHDCLQKVLPKNLFLSTIQSSEADWRCMPCLQRVDMKPLLSREAWVILKNPTTTPKKLGPGKLACPVVRAAAQSAASSSSSLKAGVNGVSSDTVATSKPNAENQEEVPNILIYHRADDDGCVPRRPSRMKLPSPKLREVMEVIKSSRRRVAQSAPHRAPSNTKGESSKSRAASNGDSNSIYTSNSIYINNSSRSKNKVVLDEVDYFAQYVLSLEVSLAKVVAAWGDAGEGGDSASTPSNGKGKGSSSAVPTEDVCFLCKDGGDVVECDFCYPVNSSRKRCLKVYHESCLDYRVPEGVRWHCPRHLCSICGAKEIGFACAFCPISICNNCVEPFVSKFGLKNYSLLKQSLPAAGLGARVISIACQNCLTLLSEAEKKGALKPEDRNYALLGEMQSFLDLAPGEDCDQNVPSDGVQKAIVVLRGRRISPSSTAASNISPEVPSSVQVPAAITNGNAHETVVTNVSEGREEIENGAKLLERGSEGGSTELSAISSGEKKRKRGFVGNKNGGSNGKVHNNGDDEESNRKYPLRQIHTQSTSPSSGFKQYGLRNRV